VRPPSRRSSTARRGLGGEVHLPAPDRLGELSPAAGLEQLGEGARCRQGRGGAEGGQVRGDERRLVEIDGSLLVTEAGQPANGGAAVALWFAVTHEQAECERVGERELRQASRTRCSAGNTKRISIARRRSARSHRAYRPIRGQFS
jgi:hypothetical protein